MPELRKVFISHSHKDEPLASAFRDTLKNIFNNVDVAFSSDKTVGGGPQSGSNWLDWIHTCMRDCQESLLLLTPYSIRQPWPMWEAGAVGGMAIINPDPAATLKVVTPIRFNIVQEALPGPFVVTQAIDGRDPESLRKLLGDLMKRYDYAGTPQATFKAVLNDQIPSLSQTIKDWLDNAPPMVTDGMVTEWCSRLDQLRDQRRSSEVRYLHHWIRLMYEGPQRQEDDRKTWSKSPHRETWDLRLHLRLAQNYAIARQFKEAIEQYSLAAQLAPLDVFVLHRLAQVYLDVADADSARQTIDHILRLDKDALKWNAEIAGLEGRYWKDEGRKRQAENKPQQAQESFKKALAAYEAAMDIDGVAVDFYMADNVGQLSLTLGDIPAAQKAYQRARAALESVTRETESVWSLATRATAALVLVADENEALGYLARIREFEPTDSQKTSICRGLQLVARALKKTDADYGRWVAALG
jgi:tetratricopeptide (TPR) repeat protein